MLVLSRKESEQVTILVPPNTEPTEIVVQFCKMFVPSPGRAGKIRLGFIAPKTTKIVRTEILPVTTKE